MYLVPALIGIFWGAPLIAREFETGTHRLAWNQSVGRTRWTAVKLGLIGAAAVATAGLLSLMIGWWASPIDQAMALGNQFGMGNHFPRLSPLVFAARGVAPLGYAAFAFALGVTAGVLIRKTVPAMAVTLAVFAAVQFLMPTFVRPHLIPPVQATAPFNANDNNELMIGGLGSTITVVGNFSRPGAWILSNNTITRSGKVFTGPATAACTGQRLAQGLHQLVEQPPPATAGQLPAREPLLAAAGDRNRHLPGPRGGTLRAERLAHPPPELTT